MIVDILQWNPIHTGNFAADIKASVYIKPTIALLNLFNRAPMNRVLVKISDSGSNYDGGVTFGILDKSSDVPNKRDNLFDCNGLYVITLGGLNWSGYPPQNGKIELLEATVEAAISYIEDKDKDKEVSNENNENNENNKKKIKENFEVPSVSSSIASVFSPSIPTFSPKHSFKNNFDSRHLALIGIFLLFSLGLVFYLNKHK